MSIKNIMHKNILCCDMESSLEQVATEMWNDDLGIVPVIDREKKLVGVITDRDIAIAAALKHKPLWDIAASELVEGKTCHFCHPEDDIHDVLKMMSEAQIRRVPIVNEQREVVGMVGVKDIAEHTARTGKAMGTDEFSSEEFLGTVRQICRPNLPQAAA
ncbi:CBS domain-containing protein [Marinobacter sp. M216]|uniref:CBS domain-containing protein n=1 Tax=Marinobacter albus TaxID=3030833 RepID=A0ABT7HEC1_9GAMM|nr:MULTISPECIES: CBS domain-containing protein [unclassified Marinobacter]MBW7469895.1 CBS domain-containing protein [Marinobacter sp. F4218]MDK9557845.1 CBS domain-containing protein [Marinobacter sp. M216]